MPSFPFTKPYFLHFQADDFGLSPTFSFFAQVGSAAPVTAPPINELVGAGLGQGWYYFLWTFQGPSDLDIVWTVGTLTDPTTLAEGVISPDDIIDVYGLSGVSKSYPFHYQPTDTGLTPAFSLLVRTDTMQALPQPPIVEIGGGKYFFEWPFQTSNDPPVAFVINGAAPAPTSPPYETFGLIQAQDAYPRLATPQPTNAGQAYATTADLYATISSAALNHPSTQAPAQQAQLLRASEAIDGYLRDQYELPLVKWGTDIVDKCCDIAAYRLVCLRGFNPELDGVYFDNFKMALDWLKQVSNGTVSPDVIDSSPSAAPGVHAPAVMPQSYSPNRHTRGTHRR